MNRRSAPALGGGGAGQGSRPENTPLVLVCGASRTVARLDGHPHLGSLVQPRAGNRIDVIAQSGRWWAADNDALAGHHPDRYFRMLNRIAEAERARLLFVTVPDAVEQTADGPRGDWPGTLWLWKSWRAALTGRRLPAAIVLQDGATVDTVPWGELAAVFVGGSTAWKEGREAAALLVEAERRGVWRHVGRLQTERRLRLLEQAGFDSCDGTQFSRHANTYLAGWLERLRWRQEGMGL